MPRSPIDSPGTLRPDFHMIRRILTIGSPGGVDVIRVSIGHLIYLRIVLALGDVAADVTGAVALPVLDPADTDDSSQPSVAAAVPTNATSRRTPAPTCPTPQTRFNPSSTAVAAER